MSDPLFHRLALLGVGLIGSSVARIARERGDLAGEIVVNARTQQTLDRVMQWASPTAWNSTPPAPSPAPTA